MIPYIKKFSEISITDINSVGGKNASLGEMYSKLAMKGVPVPDGFAVTSFAFEEFLTHNGLHTPLHNLMSGLDRKDYSNLAETGSKARELFMNAQMPVNLNLSVARAYKELGGDKFIAVAVRSSATAEDLPQASFAGQHESYLNILVKKKYCMECKNVLPLCIQTVPSNTGKTMALYMIKFPCQSVYKK